ncbi:unnamed protein product [Rotaria magnacalcarata]|uniref:SIS domain-containing protein n=1 Tax=Rotaria magnacalcarata TaxID=392030 RepID=A0A814V7M1_9BILA|nr:unnamed protein product [Rotaria magnacalcarata]CAF1183128.1 unnamed protein product [Rotaria magnacalcarata]CAF1613701.1 unnamed protein product [Rotaria magnacalcarata]
MDSVPFTERRNALTMNIDADTVEDAASRLHECNMEVFYGYENYKGLSDDEFLNKLDQLVILVKATLQNEKGIIVISGCGTSGRIGFLASTFFNQLCLENNLPKKYHYIIAGGNSALVTSVEATEDDPIVGAAELKHVSESFERVLFIGITCGLSAPFVGGQLEYCLDNPEKFIPVLIGFNPVSMARQIRVPKWSGDKTFYGVASRMEKTSGALILNPIVGPEPISGSSRMKSGTATKVMLDTVFYLASTNTNAKARDVIEEFKITIEKMKNETTDIANVIQQAGDCMINNGYIRYVGSSTFGIWGMIDASECVPTYNSSYDDIRGFMTNDYFKKSLNPESADSLVSPALDQSTPDDLWKTFQDLPPSSLIVFIDREYHLQKALVDKLQQKNHRIVWIKLLSTESLESNSNVQMIDFSKSITSADVTKQYLIAELILKLCLNTISTAAHVLKGKVYQNIMIDVRVSNIKLFYRAIDIIKLLTGVDKETAEKCLIQSIYQTNDEINNQTIEQHITAVANNKDHIVPIALLMCLSNYSYTQAKLQIDKCPRIRDICTGNN